MAVVEDLDTLGRGLEPQYPRQPFQVTALRGAFRHAPGEGVSRVDEGVPGQLALGAAPGVRNLDPAPGAHAKRLGDQFVVVHAMADQDRPRRRFVGVELPDKGPQHPWRVVVAGVAREIGAVAVVLSGAHEKNLDAGLPACSVRRDDVGLVDPPNVDIVARLDPCQRLDAIAKLRRLFELQGVTGFLHLPRQTALDRPAVAGQESARLLDEGRVFGLADAVDAGRAAALDLMQEAGPRAVREHRVRTRPKQEGLLQDAQRLVDRPRRSKRAEIVPLSAMGAAVLEHPRESMVAGEQDRRKRFVVAQQNVVARLEALDQVRLEQERLGLGVGDDKFHRRRLRHYTARAHRLARQPRVAGDPLLQAFCLAHVEDFAAGVDHPIDSGLPGKGLEEGVDDGHSGCHLRPQIRRRARGFSTLLHGDNSVA